MSIVPASSYSWFKYDSFYKKGHEFFGISPIPIRSIPIYLYPLRCKYCDIGMGAIPIQIFGKHVSTKPSLMKVNI